MADEFLLAKASYAAMTGREQKKENNVLCYQIRQSFYPGEITPKEANRIGYELAMRWTKGRHAFIVTTHTDKQHIHCHIYYNSTTLDCTRKFRNFWGSSFALRRLSDRLCLENGLSIVENPKPRSKGKYRNYGEWQKDRKGPLSYQDRLRLAIDTALAERPADLDEFLNLMKRAGYEVKTVRGGGISFRLTGQGQERFTRLRASTLGDGYDLQDVLAAIEGKEKGPGHSERKISLAVDIQAKLAAGKGPGYERWAKVFNIKQMAAALAYIQDNGLTDYEQLAQKATEAARHRFGAAINDIVSAHPECSETTITYDYEDGHTWASYWPEVLAIFAVHTNLNSDSDVVVINAAQMQRIQDTFWAMHEITYEVEEVDTTPEPTEDDPDPEQQTEYILHITVNSKTVDELAELYNFTQDQNDILHELLSDEMRPTLLALCGGISIIEDGELCWPLPGHTYISCNFGDDDAYGNSGHRGTDIPAPEGTPILAAHSGTVIISGWNNSYGNQVLLDNGAGLSTRYAHMTQTAVTAGEAVTAGQVIGYVGSTGDSTGNHLHFEVMQNGVRVNPMDMVSVR